MHATCPHIFLLLFYKTTITMWLNLWYQYYNYNTDMYKKKEKKKETNLTNNCLLKHFKILNKLIQLINNNQGMNLKSHRYLMIHIYSSWFESVFQLFSFYL